MHPDSAQIRGPLLVTGLLLGLASSALAPACIIPDYCIVVQTHGTDWCVNLEGAQMWPIGQPELAELVTDDNHSPPKGCHCLNDGEIQILGQGVPVEQHAALVEELDQAARLECAWAVPLGYDHNCFVHDDILGPTISAPFYGSESDDCVGSCGYVNEPPHGSCGADPNPWECNGEGTRESGTEETGTDETSGGGTDAGDPGITPFNSINRITQ